MTKSNTTSKKVLKKKSKPVIKEPEIIPSTLVETSNIEKYPCPKAHPIFEEKWKLFLDDVCIRDNFKRGHLSQLEILCNLYVELADMETIISEVGYTYEVESRNGSQIKPRPEVVQKNRVLSEIRNYSKMLGLLLVKDNNFSDDEEAKDNWS